MDEEIKSMAEEPVVETEEAVVEPETETVEEDEALGTITVALEVVSTIAGLAVEEVEGVQTTYTSFAGGIAERFSSKKNAKGVKIEMNGSNVSVDLYIIVDYGIKIPEIAWEVQESVKSSIETMTGLDVEKVNIHVEGIYFKTEEPPMLETAEEEEAPEEPVETEEAPEEEIVTE